MYVLEISPYKELLELKRWDRLVEQFRQENYRLFQMASQSVFTVALQAGLSALKTPYPFHYVCFQDCNSILCESLYSYCTCYFIFFFNDSIYSVL